MGKLTFFGAMKKASKEAFSKPKPPKELTPLQKKIIKIKAGGKEFGIGMQRASKAIEMRIIKQPIKKKIKKKKSRLKVNDQPLK